MALQRTMTLLVTDGDLLEQPVDAIVNPWNRNPFPWWLLLPQGVSGAIAEARDPDDGLVWQWRRERSAP